MNRRKMIGVVGASGLGLAMAGLLSGCKQNVSKWIGIVVSELEAILPVFDQVLPGSSKIVAKALEVAKEVQKALEAKDPGVVVFLEQLVAPDGLINQIIDTLGLIKDPKVSAVVAGSLVLISTALRLIADGLMQAPAGMVAKARNAHPQATQVVGDAANHDVLRRVASEVKF